MTAKPLFAEPRAAGGWYIADADMRDVRGVIYISKRAAVRAIRALSAATAAAALGILLMTAAPVYAGDRGGGPSWGTVVGAGILGGILGGAAQPQPQVIIVQPAPIYVVPERPVATQVQDPYPGYWWCELTHHWYLDAAWTATNAAKCAGAH